MNRLGRISVMLLLGGAFLLPFCARSHAQDQDKDQKDAPADKQQDSGKKKAMTKAKARKT